MFDNFPYTDMHQLNLDWIIKIAKDFLDQYTSLQQMIADGEQSLTDLTQDGLNDLQEKADTLQGLLDAWYTEHSTDIANQLADALADLNAWYTTHEHYLDNILLENIAEFEQRVSTIAAAIPEDYSLLSQYVYSIIYKTPNLVNKNAEGVITNGYVDENGDAHVESGTYQSDYIPVEANEKYTSSYTNAFVLWYDSNKDFVSKTNTSDFQQDGYVTAPATASFGRFIVSGDASNYKYWMVVKGDTLPEKYSAFGGLLDDNINAVVYNTPQEIYDSHKETARSNIGIAETLNKSVNLFNRYAQGITFDGYYDESGTYHSETDTIQSDYVPIEQFKYYTSDYPEAYVLWYDSNKDFLYKTSTADFHNNGYVQAPANAFYAKFITTRAHQAFWQISEGKTLPPYSEYGLFVNDDMTHDRFKSHNLVNKADPDFIVNGYVDESGTEHTESGTFQTGFIPVEGGSYYITSQPDAGYILWYDADKTFVEKTTTATVISAKGIVQAPATAFYARFLFMNFRIGKAQVNKGKILHPYMPYSEIPFEKTDYYGKNAVAFGTSLTYRAATTSNGYLNDLCGMLQMNVDNQGQGNGCIMQYSDLPNILTKITNYSGFASKDVCLLEGFVNDWYNQNPLGTYRDTSTTTVCGCVRTALETILTANSNIAIILILDHYGRLDCADNATRNDKYQYEYYEEISKVAESMGIPVIKEYANSKMNRYTERYIIDDIHCTQIGCYESALTIYEQMKDIAINK